MSEALVLFDIDGTLMITGGATSRAILRACQQIHGDSFEWGGVTVGKLDPQLYDQLLDHNGIEPSTADFEAYRERYINELTLELRRVVGDITILPGISELLGKLRALDEVTIGLLSGNLREAAMLKIAAAGFDPTWFEVTVFAEDGLSREDLPNVAIKSWSAIIQRSMQASRVIVVGDTPRDIQCARATGCRSVAVATGHYDIRALKACGPDVVVENLLNPTELFGLLEA